MKLILQILLIFMVVSTAVICAVKPDMHKTVLVYDSAYTVTVDNNAEVKQEEIPIMERPAITEQKVHEVEKIIQAPVTQTKTQKNIKQSVQTPKTQTQTLVKKTETPKSETKVKTETNSQPKTQVQKQEVIKKTEVPATTAVTKVQPPKVLTQQEETIAWNIWRSNLQNKIMQDVKLPLLPNGTVFRFSFTVDKYGKITNLQTWSDTQMYTPYAIQYMAPVIRSYQGRSILNFPEGTARNITDVKGGWKISDNTKYSSPNDYNDVEKVIK